MFAFSDKKLILHKDSGEGKEEKGRGKYYGSYHLYGRYKLKAESNRLALKIMSVSTEAKAVFYSGQPPIVINRKGI